MITLLRHFPGRMDTEVFFNTCLRRICDPAGAKPTVQEIEKEFQNHIQNRSSTASQGTSPATFKEAVAVANTNQVADLAAKLQKTQDQLNNLALG